MRGPQGSLPENIAKTQSALKQLGREVVVVAMVNAEANEALVRNLAGLGNVIRIADGFITPGFVDLALRIAYGSQDEVLACLNRIAFNAEKGVLFTTDDLEIVFRGLRIILPKAIPADFKTAREAYTAARKYVETSL